VTPAAAIQNGTLTWQKSTVTVLADLAAAMVRAGIGSPAVLVIGDVVRFARMQPVALAAVA
jgi:uroporphyrin-III C-methyltransferase